MSSSPDKKSNKNEEKEEIINSAISFSISKFNELVKGRDENEKKYLKEISRENGFLYRFLKNEINNLGLYNKYFGRVSKSTKEEKESDFKNNLIDIINNIFNKTIDVNTFLDCLRDEFGRPDNQFKKEGNISEKDFLNIKQRHENNKEVATPFTQKEEDRLPTVFIPEQTYLNNEQKPFRITVFNNDRPVNVVGIGIKSGHCVGDKSQNYANGVLVQNGEWAPRNLILSVEEIFDEKKPIGILAKEKGTETERLTSNREYEKINTNHFPLLTIEIQVLDRKEKDSPRKARINQVKFAKNQKPGRNDKFSMDVFVKQILPKIVSGLEKDGYMVTSFGLDLQSLKKEGTFLNIQGEDLSIKELANRDLSKEIIIAGDTIRPTETDLGNDESERIKNLNILCNLSNITLDLTDLPNKYKKEIKRIRGNLVDNSENSDKNIGSYEKLVSIGGYLDAQNSKNLQLKALTSISGNLDAQNSKNLQLKALNNVDEYLFASGTTNLQLNALDKVKNIYIDKKSKRITISKKIKSQKIISYNHKLFSPEEITPYKESKYKNQLLKDVAALLDFKDDIPVFIYID